jgi:hypothetical protein
MNESYQNLSERTKELIEARHVLRETAYFLTRCACVCVYQMARMYKCVCCNRLSNNTWTFGNHLTIVLPLFCSMTIMRLNSQPQACNLILSMESYSAVFFNGANFLVIVRFVAGTIDRARVPYLKEFSGVCSEEIFI